MSKPTPRRRTGPTATATATTNAERETRAILDAIRRVVRALRVSARNAEATVGLSGAQLFVLHKLADESGLTLGALAERTLTHQSSVSVVVTRLVAKGLVRRTRAADDARRLDLAITPAGRALLRRAPPAAQDALIAALGRLEPAPRRALARGLARVLDEMGLAAQPAALFFEDEVPPAPRRKGARRG